MWEKMIWGGLLAMLSVSVQATPLSFKTKEIKVKSACFVDKYKEKRCHQSEVAYPITGDKHFDDWVKDTWKGQLPTKKSVKAELVNDEWVKESNESNKNEDKEFPCAVSYEHTLKLEGFSPNYAVFGKERWAYTCGVHGNGVHSFIVMPRNTPNPKEVKLEDIVLPNQMDKLIELQKEAVIQYLQDPRFEMNEKEAREYFHEYNEHFYGTNEWRIGENSIVFLFQTYEVAAYSYGRPEIAIPVKDLQGIIKPEILRETEHYTPRPEKP
ncbi:MAG: DUF3298 domain-containing protein [Neisseriaceae bacterium]|nr:DUF3298 domain-containing protein [Neisseriaceae bacterium]